MRDETGETAQLWVRRGTERICIVNFESRHELRATNPSGSRLPLPAGSAGRLLAGTDDALEEIERSGWVESVGSRTPGLGSVSVGVYAADQLVGAICLAMPLARTAQSPGRDYGRHVVSAAEQLEGELVS
ncbi:DNA-binding IclR family transcriptional regulator [Zhihengliuella flava]|uniref:DNA-binding IclR family transcriptional regulator n=1 Tax=Zhihengliuella flava TaxID=1285193 RepID=A0A931DCB9_9MICC|nr:hypothetical protein [Zhihengliuella flava]MBG6084806.1 DNA-binding IclR family transcriptional regulator [Zhihengliuella flava]